MKQEDGQKNTKKNYNMNLDIIFNKCNEREDYARLVVQSEVYKVFQSNPEHNVRVIKPSDLDIGEFKSSSTSINSVQVMTIVNRDNNKAVIFNVGPRLEPSVCPKHGFDHLDVVQIIGGSALSQEFYKGTTDIIRNKIDTIRHPLTFPLDKISQEKIAVNFKKDRDSKKIKQAIFIGYTQNLNGRIHLTKILNKHPYFNIVHSIREGGIPFAEYLQEINKYKLTISLNGFAETCYRDWEAMSVYMPIIRSKFSSKYHNPLIPDYHYFSATDECVDGMTKYKKPYTDIADQFISKIEEIIDEDDKLIEVGENGREYFEKNIISTSIVNNFFKVFNINILR